MHCRWRGRKAGPESFGPDQSADGTGSCSATRRRNLRSPGTLELANFADAGFPTAWGIPNLKPVRGVEGIWEIPFIELRVSLSQVKTQDGKGFQQIVVEEHPASPNRRTPPLTFKPTRYAA